MTENIQINVRHITRVEGHGNIVVDVHDGVRIPDCGDTSLL